jgi:hypothetical protein
VWFPHAEGLEEAVRLLDGEPLVERRVRPGGS